MIVLPTRTTLWIMDHTTTNPSRSREVLESVQEELCDTLWDKLSCSDITIIDASLLQYFPDNKQVPVWNMVKDIHDPVLRFRLIHKILIFSGIKLTLGSDDVELPRRLKLPSKKELSLIIENIVT